MGIIISCVYNPSIQTQPISQPDSMTPLEQCGQTRKYLSRGYARIAATQSQMDTIEGNRQLVQLRVSVGSQQSADSIRDATVNIYSPIGLPVPVQIRREHAAIIVELAASWRIGRCGFDSYLWQIIPLSQLVRG